MPSTLPHGVVRVRLRGFVTIPMRASRSIKVISQDRLFAEVLGASFADRPGFRMVASEPEERGAEEAPDVVLLDTAGDREAALARLWSLREQWPEAKVVVLAVEREDDAVVDFVEAGACAYALRGTSLDGLVEIVEGACDGRSLCSPRVATSVLRRIAELARKVPAAPARLGEPLTERELEVLRLLAAGLRNKEIAHSLGITVQTVKNHVHNILEKLRVHRRRHAVRLACEMGLLAGPFEGGGPAD
jgi:DNA-binding NarL/FixJ family response regulator